jgi:hypothetical protein
VARAGARPLGGTAANRRLALSRETAAETRTRCISEQLLHEARRLYGLGLSLRAVFETLLERTRYASANSAEVALRFQFKRRGWALRTRAQARRARRKPYEVTLERARRLGRRACHRSAACAGCGRSGGARRTGRRASCPSAWARCSN